MRSRRAERSVLDSDRLRMLEELAGQQFLSGIIDDFLQEADDTVRSLVEAASEADLLRFRAAAHALLNGAENVGARSLG